MNRDASYKGPASLFKYRPFDEHTFDMLENKYLFLCVAEKLDDPTECMTSLNMQNLANQNLHLFKVLFACIRPDKFHYLKNALPL